MARRVSRPAVAGLGALRVRPEGEAASRKKRRRRDAGAPIDPDAGGIGATETFDPEEEDWDSSGQDNNTERRIWAKLRARFPARPPTEETATQ